MRTAEEILQKWYTPLHGIGDIAHLQIVEAMKEYAIEVAKETLKNASDSFYTSHEENKLDNVFTAINVISSETNIPKLD